MYTRYGNSITSTYLNSYTDRTSLCFYDYIYSRPLIVTFLFVGVFRKNTAKTLLTPEMIPNCYGCSTIILLQLGDIDCVVHLM